MQKTNKYELTTNLLQTYYELTMNLLRNIHKKTGVNTPKVTRVVFDPYSSIVGAFPLNILISVIAFTFIDMKSLIKLSQNV